MINRNNYEEYLLLYIDGELSPSERAQVTAFLEVNPDLLEELRLLEQTILSPDEASRFENRQELYREASGISISNYQEFFLTYVDGELDASSQEAVETFVLQNPHLQDEFTLLKQAVLPKETIEFENKASLYRREEKRRPVVIGIFRVSVAAAVLMGIVALLWVLDTPTQTDPISNKPQTPSTTDERQPITPSAKAPAVVVAEEKMNETKSQAVQPMAPKQDPKAFVAELPKENNQAPLIAQVPEIQNSTTLYPGNTVDIENNTIPENMQQTISTTGLVAPVQTAAYVEELETEEDKTLYVGALEINPDKVRGFFRKAGRLLGGKKNSDESNNKVQVANLEFNKLK